MKKIILFSALATGGLLQCAQEAEPEVVRFHLDSVVFHEDRSGEQQEFERKAFAERGKVIVAQATDAFSKADSDEIAEFRDGFSAFTKRLRAKQQTMGSPQEKQAAFSMLAVEHARRKVSRGHAMPRRHSALDEENLNKIQAAQKPDEEQQAYAQELLERLNEQRAARLQALRERQSVQEKKS